MTTTKDEIKKEVLLAVVDAGILGRAFKLL